MSSTNKTDHLGLNNWLGTDKPKREDFNFDNNLIDNAFYSHTNNEVVHTSADERAKWNSPYYISTYVGNGSVTRTVETGCPFTPAFGMIFAAGRMPMMNESRILPLMNPPNERLERMKIL